LEHVFVRFTVMILGFNVAIKFGEEARCEKSMVYTRNNIDGMVERTRRSAP